VKAFFPVPASSPLLGYFTVGGKLQTLANLVTWLQNHFIILLVKFVCLSCDFYSANSANSCHFLSILANSANSLFFHPANSLFFILYFIILPILYSFIPFISNMKSPCDV
jgi:hypothetical protein